MLRERRGDVRARGTAPAAPRRAELDQRGPARPSISSRVGSVVSYSPFIGRAQASARCMRRTNSAGSSSWPPSASSAWSNSRFAQSAKRSSARARAAATIGCSRIHLEDRLRRRAPSGPRPSACARDCRPCRPRRRPGTTAIRSAGASTRTSLTLSPSAALHPLDQRPCAPRPRVSLRGFSSSLAELAEVELALAPPTPAACPSNSCRCATIHSSTRSAAAAPRCPSCGRSPGAGCCARRAKRVGGDVVDLVLAFLHARDVVGERHVCSSLSLCVEAKRSSFAMRSRLAASSTDAFLQHAAELLPERRVLLLLVFARAPRAGRARAWSQPARIASTSRISCRISRETLSGRSSESTTPRTKRRYARQQLLGVVHDEHAPHVQLERRADARGPTGRTARASGCRAAACTRCGPRRGCASTRAAARSRARGACRTRRTARR